MGIVYSREYVGRPVHKLSFHQTFQPLQASVEQRCSEAFAAVRHFEKTHCLALQNMGFPYLQRRGELVNRCTTVAAALGVKAEAAHDAVLLMDRVMSTSLNLAADLLDLLAAACVVIAAKQIDGPASSLSLPVNADLQAATGLPSAAVEQMEWNVRQVLGQDTAAISTLRCLKLYLERLGAHQMDEASAAAMAGRAVALVTDCLTDMAFLNCRPSVIAAAVLYTDRRARGVIPFWPTMLAKLTGYQDMSTPELSVAIKAAQRVCSRANGTSTSPTSTNGNGLNAAIAHGNSNASLARQSSSSSMASSNPASSSAASASSAGLSAAGSIGVMPPVALSAAEQAVLLALQKGDTVVNSLPPTHAAVDDLASALAPAVVDTGSGHAGSNGSGGLSSSGRSSADNGLMAEAVFLARQD